MRIECVPSVRASSTENLSVRIGIATGPVVVGEQSGVGEQSKLAVGSTPNLAARLQGLADGRPDRHRPLDPSIGRAARLN